MDDSSSSDHASDKVLPFPTAAPGSLNHHSPTYDKVGLFRTLFKGRNDVYPLRFESQRTGRSGYQPACANEWVRLLCDKPRIKCFDCANRSFLPVTDKVIYSHLSGYDSQGNDFVIGLYPMLLDDTCYFLTVDFDRDCWQEDSLAFVATCEQANIPCALERSRSGYGAHVWLFFSEALPAIKARQLGCYLLTRTMEQHPSIGLRSYDRLFPNQDTLPKGGFGNLIALPLQGKAREQGNSVFVDQNLKPYVDQWVFLNSIKKITAAEVTQLTDEASKRGRIIAVRFASSDEDDPKPWTALPSRKYQEPVIKEPLPAQLKIVLADQLYIPKEELPAPLLNRLIRLAAFQNPEFYRAQAMRLSTYDKPRIIDCAEDHPLHLALPRGCLDDLRKLLKKLKIKTRIQNKQFKGEKLELTFQGELRPDQEKAAAAMLRHDTGVLSATTAFGKTVLAAWMIAQRGVNTLILVHRQQLQEQWIERLSQFLDIDPKKIGRLGAGRKRLTGNLDVALIQSVVRKGVVDDLVADYGHVIVDECHHISARSFELAIRRSKARYILGLSATVVRKDGHHPIVFMQCGPIRYRVDAREQAAIRPFNHQVIVRPTGFRASAPSDPDMRIEFQQLYSELLINEARNQLICNDVITAVRDGRSPLVLTERTQHLETLVELLRPYIKHVITLRGGMGKKKLLASLNMLEETRELSSRVIIATGRFVGEGFDESCLDTLFLTLPVSWRGTIAQYVGRLHRLHHDKKEVRVYDYADLDVPMLSRMFDRRCQGYEAVGYTLLLPASALPGWPSDVPLPLDAQWKNDYSASVQRLIRDGIDPPLAQAFLHATQKPEPNATGANRARSASEAFLYRRLQSLPDTTDLFQLNANLSIPFDQTSQMEVDFLCEKHQLVIELDGHQHLESSEAYRRDRRKDALLQESNYFILRFLAEDLTKHLEDILNTIERTLTHLARR
ncbi:MAG: DEAD/DEAH box helicase family protein [Verrucomicrobiales bacterium]|nr:DEAD/DEAH box helicase family protein [Verrucomicrobiales bacterium]